MLCTDSGVTKRRVLTWGQAGHLRSTSWCAIAPMPVWFCKRFYSTLLISNHECLAETWSPVWSIWQWRQLASASVSPAWQKSLFSSRMARHCSTMMLRSAMLASVLISRLHIITLIQRENKWPSAFADLALVKLGCQVILHLLEYRLTSSKAEPRWLLCFACHVVENDVGQVWNYKALWVTSDSQSFQFVHRFCLKMMQQNVHCWHCTSCLISTSAVRLSRQGRYC